MLTSKKDPIILATTKVSVAKVAFTQAADQLEEASAHLVAIAAAADDEADRQALRAAAARSQAGEALRSAKKIRELLS